MIKLNVYDSETDALLPGKPSQGLAALSNQPGADGTVAARLVAGVWEYAPDADPIGAPVTRRDVYVGEKPDPQPANWRENPPLNP